MTIDLGMPVDPEVSRVISAVESSHCRIKTPKET
jgi:hypothetical protein